MRDPSHRNVSPAINNRGEATFAAVLERRGVMWFYQPKTFTLPAPLYTYRPDFYVVEDACFYEVGTSRRARTYSAPKIRALRETYPEIKIEFVDPSGASLHVGRGSSVHSRGTKALYHRSIERPSPIRQIEGLRLAMVALGFRSYAQIAVHLGMTQPAVAALFNIGRAPAARKSVARPGGSG